MDTDKIKVFGSRVRVENVAKVAEIELAEKEKMKDKVDLICKHDINVFINRQLIYNYPEQLFADRGIMAIEHADFDGIERLALVTGGEIVSTFGNPDLVKLGKCDLIEQVTIGEETLLKFSGVPLGEACSIVLRGATEQIIAEAERSLHDALCVLASTVKETRTCFGGGSSEMLMANAVDAAAAKTPGKEARAMEAFAHALRQLPVTIAENGGYDAAQLLAELRALHTQGKHTMGLGEFRSVYSSCQVDCPHDSPPRRPCSGGQVCRLPARPPLGHPSKGHGLGPVAVRSFRDGAAELAAPLPHVLVQQGHQEGVVRPAAANQDLVSNDCFSNF